MFGKYIMPQNKQMPTAKAKRNHKHVSCITVILLTQSTNQHYKSKISSWTATTFENAISALKQANASPAPQQEPNPAAVNPTKANMTKVTAVQDVPPLLFNKSATT